MKWNDEMMKQKTNLPLFHGIIIEICRTWYPSGDASRHDVSWRSTPERFQQGMLKLDSTSFMESHGYVDFNLQENW